SVPPAHSTVASSPAARRRLTASVTWPIVPVLVAMCLTGACLRPVGFPWGDEVAASGTGGDATGTSTAQATGPLTTESGGATTLAVASTTGLEPATTSGATVDGSSSTTGSSTTSSTTAPAPECGDGIVDPGEDCDDGNDDDDDGCTNNCGRDRLVFVTDAHYAGHALGGLDGADALCRAAAQQAGLPRPFAFKAWLSDRTTDARERLHHGRGRYLRLDGQVVARSWDDLVDGTLENPISVTETLKTYTGDVWTGTRPDGTCGPSKGDQCEDWTEADLLDPLNGGYHGYASEIDGLWTFVPDEPITLGPCGGELALYCIEQ
ncbi:MAG TPA: DUF4215 domain-containing protein, partial [Nannocystis sp.]